MRRARLRDYAILLAVSAVLTLPNLGATSLWDVDEGVNAEAAREMRDNDTWVIPTFNYQLRTAKPVMLYWLQRVSYALFGVSEWSARLPSVLAAFLAVLLTYELARRMFDRTTGLLAGVVLASAFEFCLLAHAATPDAVLLLFTVLTYYLFWTRHLTSSIAGVCDPGSPNVPGSQTPATEEAAPLCRWWIPTAAACGLAMLTKGPVGVALPGLVLLLYFAWNRELGRLLDHKIVIAALVFVLVAGPWYGLVAAETRGAWTRAFFGRENVQRFTTSMENHHGPFYYHAAALFGLFAPWSVFLVAAVWYGVKGTRKANPTPQPPPPGGEGEKASGGDTAPRAGQSESGSEGLSPPLPLGEGVGGWGSPSHHRPFRFLICWFGAYLVFFSAAATKLPNYVLPLYPALAILTARFLERWRTGALVLPKWMMPGAVAGLFVLALGTVVGMLVAGDAVKVRPAGSQVFPGLERWAVLGVVPLAAGVLMILAVRAGDRDRFVRAMAVGAVVFTALAAAFPPLTIDAQKAPRELVRASGVDDPVRDVRLAQFHCFQPSLVFYARREVAELKSPEVTAAFLTVPTPAYVFISAQAWEQTVGPLVWVPTRIVARHFDYNKNCEILVVTNDVTAVAGR